MKFNPITQTLYTNSNVLIKKLDCPYSKGWQHLALNEDRSSRRCDVCAKDVIDTQGLSDEVVLEAVMRDPATCLKVALSQENIRVVNFDV